MKKYSVHFEISRGRETKSGVLVSANYDFWEPLLSYFIKNVLILGLTAGRMKMQQLQEQKFLEKFLVQI